MQTISHVLLSFNIRVLLLSIQYLICPFVSSLSHICVLLRSEFSRGTPSSVIPQWISYSLLYHIGRMIAVVQNFHGRGSIAQAELQALIHGLDLCSSLGMVHFEVENDSQFVVQTTYDKHISNWKLSYLFRECLERQHKLMTIKHVFRQANIMADRCTNGRTNTRLGKNASRSLLFLPTSFQR